MKLLSHYRPVVVRKHRRGWVMPLILLALFVRPASGADDKIQVFRTGDELIMKLDRFDLLRQAHAGLNAVLKLHGDGKDKELRIDLTDAAVQGPMVIDLTRFGKCSGIDVTVKDGAGQMIAEKTFAPVPEIPVQSSLTSSSPGQSASAGRYAYIEPGTEIRKAQEGGEGTKSAAPQILLPEVKKLRQINLSRPPRVLSHKEITFPVKADCADFPLPGGCVVLRQTAAPDDPAKASLYFFYKKAIYEDGGTRLVRWQKFLVEVPVQNSWGAGQGDESLVLAPNQFEVHITHEKTPGGLNILGEGDSALGQAGGVDIDERGRIYWKVYAKGAYIARFDPKTKKFEQPPAKFGIQNFQALVPAGAGSLNDGLCGLTCTRGRVFLTMCNDTLSSGPAGKVGSSRRLGGVFSIPQDWTDEAAFYSDIRLHVGSWESATPALYKTPPKADADVRKLGGSIPTETGLFIVSAGGKYTLEGGPWRLDLDGQGNNKVFGEVKSISDTVAADGTKLAPTRFLSRPRPNPQLLLDASCGEIKIPRASIRQLLRSDGWDDSMAKKASSYKHAKLTYDGAPQGIVTVRYDLVEKLKTAPEAQGALAESVTGGSSQGPCFLVTPIPGEPDKAVSVSEYPNYYLSVLDFSKLKEAGTVLKSFRPARFPVSAGLGPYNSLWLRHDDEQWLYINGYTGMTRVRCSKGGKVLDELTALGYTRHMAPQALDGHNRTSMKKVDGILPVFGGRMINSGYGLAGRGGDAFSTGIELFDTKLLASVSETNRVPSQTLAYMSRCFSLKTLQSRLIWDALDGSKRQEVFAASGSIRQSFVNDLNDPSVAPKNLDAKIFLYEVSEKHGLRDLYGFSLPVCEKDKAVEGHLALSPCRRFLVIMTQDGVLYTYSIAQKQFIDGLVPRTPAGNAIQPLEFHRPSEIIFSAPNGQIFFVTAPFDQEDSSIHFNRVAVDNQGRLKVEPHLGIRCASNREALEFDRIVKCFLPDLKTKDGSCDLVLGYSQSTVQPFVRVITDFVPPAR